VPRLWRAWVNDLRELTRRNLGGVIPIEPTMLDMAAFCEQAIADARATHPGCEFEFLASGDLHCKVDARRLKQAVCNLLDNAAQYSWPGEAVHFSAQGATDAVTLRVRNVGSVIPQAAMASIFEALVQLEPDPADRGRAPTSIGLGLYIAREIIRAHGGSIEVSSSESDGTVFTLRVPKAAR